MIWYLQLQARRCYEMLRLQATNIHDDAKLKEYRLDLKRRLNVPYEVNVGPVLYIVADLLMNWLNISETTKRHPKNDVPKH